MLTSGWHIFGDCWRNTFFFNFSPWICTQLQQQVFMMCSVTHGSGSKIILTASLDTPLIPSMMISQAPALMDFTPSCWYWFYFTFHTFSLWVCTQPMKQVFMMCLVMHGSGLRIILMASQEPQPILCMMTSQLQAMMDSTHSWWYDPQSTYSLSVCFLSSCDATVGLFVELLFIYVVIVALCMLLYVTSVEPEPGKWTDICNWKVIIILKV